MRTKINHLTSRIKGLLRRPRYERELREELAQHVERKIEANIAGGMSPTEARQAALRAFGGVEQTAEGCRELNRLGWLEDPLRDARYGLRQLGRHPGFTAVIIITLAFGIGANTAIFSYLNAFAIQPLAYPHPEKLVVFESHNTKLGWTTPYGITSTASFLDFEKQQHSFAQIAKWTNWQYNITGNGLPRLVDGGKVSWNYFAALGARPLLGRTFTADEDQPGHNHVVILSQGLWQTRYGGRRSIVGQGIEIADQTYTVVGVMPAAFQYPLMGVSDLWTPLTLNPAQRARRNHGAFAAFGRLAPGVDRRQAAAECAAIYAQLARQFPASNQFLTLEPACMPQLISREEGAPELLICFCIVGFILLMACANIANLLLSRAVGRRKEFALRHALGASRARLARQMLVETVLLFLCGGACGLVVGLTGVRWIYAQIPAHVRGYLVNYGKVNLNSTTLAFTFGIAIVCGLICGLAPVFEHAQDNVHRGLKEASAQASGSRRGNRMQRMFVGAEIALAVIVLISTALIVKSFLVTQEAGTGFNPHGVTVAQLALPGTKYAQPWRQRQFATQVLGRIQRLPGMEAAAMASAIPFGSYSESREIAAAGRGAPPAGERPAAQFTAVTPGYFAAMRIPLRQGRRFTRADASGAYPVAIINAAVARYLWPGENPLGRKISIGAQHTVCTVVGLAGSVKNRLFGPGTVPREMYVPFGQFPALTQVLIVRTQRPDIDRAIKAAVFSADHDQAIASIEPMQELIAIQGSGQIILNKLMIFFAGLALFLGAIGVYGLVADQVAANRREIGIRMALGASANNILGRVLGQGLKLAGGGVAVGLVCALGTSRLLAAELFGVSPGDPLIFTAVPILLGLIVLLASLAPARRAMKTDPVRALRWE